MNHPEVVDRLAILNAAHPRKLSQGLHHPGQLRKSWYFFFFDLPDLPEAVVHADHWHFFRHFLRDARPACTPEETDRYIEAWSQPGAATGMIDYYGPRCGPRPNRPKRRFARSRRPPWSSGDQRDRYLGPELAEPDHDDVPNLDRVERLPDASHWVHHDEAERVNQLLIDFSPPPCQPRTDQGLRRAPGARVELEIAALLLAVASVGLTLGQGPRPAPPSGSMATTAAGTDVRMQAPQFLAGPSATPTRRAGNSGLAGPQARVAEELVMTQAYRTLRVAPSDEGVLGVVIDAPPMNLIGPELVRDLVDCSARWNPARRPGSWCWRAPTRSTSSRTST